MSFNNIDNVGGSQGIPGPTGPGGRVYRYTTTSLTDVVDGDYIIANASGGTFNLTLPLSPANGEVVTVVDYDKSFNSDAVVLPRNGESISGIADDYCLDVDGVFIEAAFGPGGWQVYDLTRVATSTGGGGVGSSRKDGQESQLSGVSGATDLALSLIHI